MAFSDDMRVDLTSREEYPRVFEIRTNAGEKPLAKARGTSEQFGRLPIWSLDLPNPTNDPARKGLKRFVVASYSAFQDHYRLTEAHNRCFYEIILSKLPTRLYVDVDAQLDRNLALTEGVIAEMIGVLVHEVVALANELRGTAAGTPVPFTVLDSSSAGKLSKHIVFDLFLRNNYHCGAFMRRVRNRLGRKFEKSPAAGDRDRDHPYYLWAEVKDPSKPKSGVKMLVRTFFADLAVYTKRRNFRIYGSSKRIEGALPLLAEGDAGFNWDVYKRCLLQRRMTVDTPVYDCLEDDESVPQSTSDTYYLRTDGVVAPSAARTDGNGKPKKASGRSSVGAPQPAKHLAAHWNTVFPFEAVFDTLARTPPSGPGWTKITPRWQREYSFADASNRWTKARCFNSAADFRAAVLALLPATIHVGAARDVDGDNSSAAAGPRFDAEPFQPTLAFDVDIRDYTPFRPCCGSTGGACARCWPIAAFAQRALSAFVMHMKLGTPVCFFSGSKGIHMWVMRSPHDTTPNPTSAAERRGMVNWLQSMTMQKGTDVDTATGDAMTDVAAPAPPQQQQSRYRIPAWELKADDIPFAQDALGSAANRAQLEHFVATTMELGSEFNRHANTYSRDSALLHVLWPRIDAEVTASPAHKIKSPFCVHPRTSRVCVWLKSHTVNPYSDEIDPHDNAEEFAAFCRGHDAAALSQALADI